MSVFSNNTLSKSFIKQYNIHGYHYPGNYNGYLFGKETVIVIVTVSKGVTVHITQCLGTLLSYQCTVSLLETGLIQF